MLHAGKLWSCFLQFQKCFGVPSGLTKVITKSTYESCPRLLGEAQFCTPQSLASSAEIKSPDLPLPHGLAASETMV